MRECDYFQDIQNMFKSTKPHTGMDDIPLTEDSIAQIGKELWLEIMNDENCHDSMIIFQDYILSL